MIGDDISKLEKEFFKEGGGPLNVNYLIEEKGAEPSLFIAVSLDERFIVDPDTFEIKLNEKYYGMFKYKLLVIIYKILKLFENIFK